MMINYNMQQYNYTLTYLLDIVENGVTYYKNTQAGKRHLMHDVREMLDRAEANTSPFEQDKQLFIHGLKAMFPTTENILRNVTINELLSLLANVCDVFYIYVMDGSGYDGKENTK